MRYTIAIIVIVYVVTVQADIVLDGSLGPKTPLMGPNFTIDAHLGQQRGSNLFHSFQSFGLEAGEIATFMGPPDVQNIISRVTGGQVSHIDGTVRVTVPSANLYFLNPAGIFLGNHAQLDTTGSIYFSTANYLRLDQAGLFATTVRGNTLLSVAAPSAFGFLRDKPGIILVQGSQLAVTPGNTLSLTGGNLWINVGTFLAPTGNINLTSVAGKGEVSLNDSGSDSLALGNIVLTHRSTLDVSGETAGTIRIQGGRFMLNDHSQLLANAENDKIPQNTPIFVEASQLIALSNSQISTHGNVHLGESEFIILDNSSIYLGERGSVHIATDHFLKDQRSHIEVSSPLEIQTLTVNSTPEIYQNQQIAMMPTEFFNIPHFIEESCRDRDNREKSRLTSVGRRGLPISSEDFQPSSLPYKGLLDE